MVPINYRPAATGRGVHGVALIVLNLLACGAALILLLPLAVHIFGCTEGSKWCHLAAMVYGLPAGLVTLLLGAGSLPWALGGPKRRRVDLLLVLVPLGLTAGILLLLVIAVIVDA